MFQIRRATPPPVSLLLPALFLLFAFAGCQGLKSKRNGGQAGPLRMELHSIPETIRLGETRRFLAEAIVINTGNRGAVLTWPSQQRSDAELFDSEGRLLHRWSDDQAFDRSPARMLLNPGERAFFEMVMPTRGMVAGGRYQLAAKIVGAPPLESKINLTPLE